MMPPSLSLHRCSRGAFALVLVLIIVSVLALVVIGFLSSMSQERATASAFANKTRAEQSAQAGVDTAMGILRDYFKAFPDSATVWEVQSTNSDGTKNEGASLYLRAVPDANGTLPNPAPNPGDTSANSVSGNGPNNVDSTGADSRKTFVLPLISGATPVLQANRSLPASNATGYTDLNSRRFLGDNQGWIGSPPNYTNPSNASLPKPVRVPWVEIKQQDGVTNPANAPVTGRYAFWIEDESFKANINYAGLGDSANIHQRADNTKSTTLTAANLDLLATLTAATSTDPTTDAMSLFNMRSIFPGALFPERRAFCQAAGLNPPHYSDIDGNSSLTSGQKAARTLSRYQDQISYLATTQSSALNLSRHGTQRLNLNSVIYPPSSATYTTTQNQIDKIVQAIRFHAPNFGQRFYRTKWSGNPPVVAAGDLNNTTMVASTSVSPHTTIYLYKIAANLHDYIGSSMVPTVINAGGQVRPNGRPTAPINFQDGDNPVWAIGKAASPVIQEGAMRYAGSIQSGRYTIFVDYYVELWNMSDRTITSQDLGPHPFVRITDQPIWVGYNTTTSTPSDQLTDDTGISLHDTVQRDFDIDISRDVNNAQVVFPPGVATVITTDPNWQTAVYPTASGDTSIADTNSANQTEAAKHFVVCPISSAGGKRQFTGPMPTGCSQVRMVYRNAQSSTSSDYETEITVGNDNGYLDSMAGGIPIVGGTISIPRASSARIVNGGYLRGNAVHGYAADGSTGGGLQPSEVGDPRTNNEQLSFAQHIPSSADGTDQTGYKEFDKNPGSYQILPSFGLPNLSSVAPAKPKNPWPDYYWFPGSPVSSGSGATAVMNAANTPAVSANAALTSIGQLGDIFDPARLPASSTNDPNVIAASRGGGRTLRIGQHDDLYDGTANSPSSTWAAWRLADIFSISDAIEQPGLININGLTRDNGAALLTAFQGFNFQPQTLDPGTANYDALVHGDAQTAGKSFAASGVQNFITDVINKRLTNSDPTQVRPFFERGELSETPILNPSTSGLSSLVNGVNMNSVFDRGREEIVRRLIEMTTTKGNVFTVYAIGQSISQTNPADPTTKRITGTTQLRVTFRLTPKTSAGDRFHPATDTNGNLTDFDPTKPQDITSRFSKPDHYDIEVLSVTSSGS